MKALGWRGWGFLILIMTAVGLAVGVPHWTISVARTDRQPASPLSAAEFSRLIRDLSEEGGYFQSDNFTSNETSYLHIVGKLRELGVSGGAYIGVGPEQNFTYIAKVRPSIAFIVDIRRQAVLQHLLYKAVFMVSDRRADFLSLLLSRPLAPGALQDDSPVETLVDYFEAAPAPVPTFESNLRRIEAILVEQCRFSLSEQDRERLRYVYSTFRTEGLAIGFRIGGGYWGGRGRFPSLKDLILQPDQKGKLGNFLATDDDYGFVRDLQRNNLIIPIVGDFAGPKALAAVGSYLRNHGFTVRAFYTSNVEQYLFQNRVFDAFVGNVRRLPIGPESVFIRGVSSRGQPHPARLNGHRSATVLQKISVFLDDYDQGLLNHYRTLVSLHFIAGD